MKAKHTPSPWLMASPGSDSKKNYMIMTNDREQLLAVATLPANSSEEELEANSKLMAAAPELLEALVWLCDQIPSLDGDISIIGMANVMKTIKKATE